MPVMNGFECTRKIRKFEKNNSLSDKDSLSYIIGLSAHCNDQNKEKCISSGMNCYSKYIYRQIIKFIVTKPFDSAVIGKMLKELRLV